MKNLRNLAGVILLLTIFTAQIFAQNYSSEILHATWDLVPNWQTQSIAGKVGYQCVTTRPIAGLDGIWLDTKGQFKFTNVRVDKKPAKYLVTENGIIIAYPTKFKKGRKFSVSFDYSVKPTGTDAKNPTGDDKGLYFVNPTGSIPGWPTMMYSQCETENLSRFIPSHDQLSGNDKFTATISLTVPDTMVTASNGLLVFQKKLPGGLRKDVWKMDQPIASYLYFIGAGNFAVITDKWKDVALQYYVEKPYAKYATGIYRRTPEQIQFFSDLLGADYPWSKYGQITVRNYKSGAMENVSITLFAEFLTGTTDEVRNSNWNDLVVCHELFHHWFGDYVTCQQWGYLPLNESFATLAEYLWGEHLNKNDAQVFRKSDRLQYFGQSYGLREGFKNHPLIDTALGNNDREKMFDRISYDKGGLILWMLKSELGDSVFFKSLNHYLTTHQYGYAGPEDLKESFEIVSGENLDSFFQQWFYESGHPVLSFDYIYTGGKLIVQTEQLQKAKYGWQLFDLRIPVSVYTNGSKQTFWLDLNSKSVLQKFEFVVNEPSVVIPDEERNLLVDWHFNYSLEDYSNILFGTDAFMPQYEAADSLIAHKAMFPGFRWNAVCSKMSEMSDWRFRFRTVQNSHIDLSNVAQNLIANSLSDPHYYVRLTGIQRVSGSSYDVKLANMFLNDPSLEVQSAALLQLAQSDSLMALNLAYSRWQTRPNDFMHERYLTSALSWQFAKTGMNFWAPYFKDVCEHGNFYCRQEVKEPMKTWLWRMNVTDRQDFLSYLQQFDGEFSDVIEFFVPKSLTTDGSGK